MTRMIGDIPQDQKDHAEELAELEYYLDTNPSVPLEFLAKGYVCLAHDWYELYVEEEGDRLLEKAEKVMPDYFESGIHVHTGEDPNFALVIDKIYSLLLENLFSKILD